MFCKLCRGLSNLVLPTEVLSCMQTFAFSAWYWHSRRQWGYCSMHTKSASSGLLRFLFLTERTRFDIENLLLWLEVPEMAQEDDSFAATMQQQFDSEYIGFAIEPITTCTHVPSRPSIDVHFGQPCRDCRELTENWQCLTCDVILCSRYRNAHMLQHYSANKEHAVCLSYSDLSVWCFACENYIQNEESVMKEWPCRMRM